jgi:hypothetical protein
MMLATHALVGGFLGLFFLPFGSAFASQAVLVGMLGSVIPDLDMIAEHRETLHRPFQMLAVFSLFAVIFAFYPLHQVVLVAIFAFSMSLHCFMDVLSNGKTMRPLENPDDRAVYNHVSERWIKPKRFVLEGSFPDILLTVFFGAALITALPDYALLFAGVIASGLFYTGLSYRIRTCYTQYDRYSELIQKKLIGRGPEMANK